MSILNENFEFASVSLQVGKAFRGIPQKVLVPVGEWFFSVVITQNSHLAGNGLLFGQQWFDQKDHAPLNLATVRHVALSLAKRDTHSKASVRLRLKRAGWDDAYLFPLLNI